MNSELAEVSRFGAYCRNTYAVIGDRIQLYYEVHIPIVKIRKKIPMDKLEGYYDRYLSLEGDTDMNFQEWLIMTVYKENT